MHEDRLKSHASRVLANSLVRCAIYARFSSENQRESSCEDQIRNCRELAARKGWTIVEEHIYRDDEKTGTTVHGREGFARLMEAAKSPSPPFDRILIDDTSRFARNKPEALLNCAILKFHRVYLYFVEDHLDSAEPWFDRAFDANADRDQEYSHSLGHKVRRGKRGRFLEGYHPGNICYGYTNVPHEDPTRKGEYGRPFVHGVWQVINPEEARIVVRFFECYAAGMSRRQIATMLNEEGIPTAMSSHSGRLGYWTRSALGEMLKNRRYIGETTWGRSYQERNPSTGKMKTHYIDADDWDYKEKPELRIISDELFERVQQRLKLVATKYQTLGGMSRATKGRVYLFSGHVKCGTCGGSMRITCTVPPRYGCSRHRESNTCANCVTIKASDLEEQFMAALVRNLESNDIYDEIANAVWNKVRSTVARRVSLDDERKRLEAEKKSLDMQKKNVMAALRTLGTSPSIEEEIREMDRQIARADTAMAALASPPPKTITEKEVRKFLTGAMQQLRELLRAKPEAVRDHFQQVLGQITLTPAEDQRGPIYKVAGDVGLFLSPDDDVQQSNRLESVRLQYTIPISLEIVPYRNKRRKEVASPVATRSSAQDAARGQIADADAIWREVIAMDTDAFLEAGIATLKTRGALQIGPVSKSRDSDPDEYLFLPSYRGLRLAAIAA